MVNEASAGTVLILPPSPGVKIPPTLIVGCIVRPSGETKLPEQPPASRTDESCASVSHCLSGVNPYFFATFCEGKLS